MKKFISNIKADKLTYRGFIFSLFLIILPLAYVLIYYKSLPPFIPLFNQLPWGLERIAPTIYIFIPIAIYIAVFLFNIIFTSVVYGKNPLIARFLAATTLLIGIMNFLFIIRTVFVIL